MAVTIIANFGGFHIEAALVQGGIMKVEQLSNVKNGRIIDGILDGFFRASSETFESIQESTLMSNGQKKAHLTGYGTDLFQFYK
ncbi:hypothetical protein IQ07DRAFT_647759 [Pyrenochaeta sp. DS3sAY3a]|nr:hypothetical protein IQ07DRAFT_647759 [Pyrenochaeta sp. DS3sAY3a]